MIQSKIFVRGVPSPIKVDLCALEFTSLQSSLLDKKQKNSINLLSETPHNLKIGGGGSNIVGIICPPSWNRVN